MALPDKGSWIRETGNTLPYATALVWGTGIDPVHEVYGEGPPLRVHGRVGDLPEKSLQSVSEELDPQYMWGYENSNKDYSGEPGVIYDARPAWTEYPPEYRGTSNNYPPLNATGMVKSLFRGFHGGAHRIAQKLADSIPSETVSEGWINKAHGVQDDAMPSDPRQYEVQTSMQQRMQRRVNIAAVDRGTDDPRTEIESRVVGQKLKYYSEGERHYDMWPYMVQQDIYLRPFWYRTAGTDDPEKMESNEMTLRSPVRRVVPSDPSLGPTETDIPGNDFGYTPEDYFYA